MRPCIRSLIIAIALFGPVARATTKSLPPIVSTAWLSQNLQDSRLVVLDIRSTEQYGKGHIPGSISAPMKQWVVASGGLTLELPTDAVLSQLLGKLGIRDGNSKWVVIVNKTETDFGRADATRVAWTCMTAGMRHVAVLSGGYSKWAKEDRPKSDAATIPLTVDFQEVPDKSIIATKNHVRNRLGKAIILDARIPEDYFGISSKPGHIKGAINLPTPWVFTPDGAFREEADLQAMVLGVLGRDTSKEVLVYCGVGGYASTWWYLLTQLFGYKNVKVYDGSMEEWIKDQAAPTSTFTWH